MSANFTSISPIDGSTVWRGSQSTHTEIDSAVAKAAAAARQWRQIPLAERINVTQKYRRELESQRKEIEKLIVHEVGKLPWDATAEVNASIGKIALSIDAIRERRSSVRLTSNPPGGPVTRRVEFQPLGVVLVLGPFNFPLHLPSGQIIPALLAGNSVVFKPSEQATAIGQWMIQAWQNAGLPPDVLQPIYGGPDVASRAIDSQHTAAVFLTGSHTAGVAIHRQLAGRTNVLLALELGGNNPIVVAPEAPAEQSASIISASAYTSAGQRCTCARRAIFIRSEKTDAQIDALVEKTKSLRVGMPNDSPVPHVGPMISELAADRLNETYTRSVEMGCRPLIDWQADARAKNLISPSLLDGSLLSKQGRSELGSMEWFGPMLIIQIADDFANAVELAADTPYGLAAALLGGTPAQFEHFSANVGAGVVNWNGTTTGAAGALPFGGLGASGNHRPAGYYAVDFCNDPVAILDRSQLPDDDPWSVAK